MVRSEVEGACSLLAAATERHIFDLIFKRISPVSSPSRYQREQVRPTLAILVLSIMEVCFYV
jgi:hypothetical protein